MALVKYDPKARARRAETLGLLLIALAILVTVLARWGGMLAWGFR